MEFIDLAKKRYALRKMSSTPAEREKIDHILEAGRLAPTALNWQPQRIVVIESPEAMEKLRKCTPYHFGASLAFLVCYDKRACWRRNPDGKSSGDIDAAIVGTHMILAAAECGIGTTWVMYFDPAAMAREFSLPDYIEPVSLLVAGYPAENARPSKLHFERFPLEYTVSFNSYTERFE